MTRPWKWVVNPVGHAAAVAEALEAGRLMNQQALALERAAHALENLTAGRSTPWA